MDEVQVRFQKYKDLTELPKTVSLDFRLGEARDAVQILLGLPENESYRLGLVRTGKLLGEQLTFREAGIQQNDQIILIAGEELPDWEAQVLSRLQSIYSQPSSQDAESTSRGNTYKLLLTISSDCNRTWEYSITLDDFYENYPEQFFTDFDGQERQKFESFLQQVLQGIPNSKINKILRTWCEEIAQGYRNTPLKVE